MKTKNFIFFIFLLFISGCSLVNEKNIKESNNINVENFLEIQTNTGNIINKDIDNNIKNEIEINDINKKTNNSVKIEIDLKENIIKKTESEIEVEKLDEELKKLIDILFEVSN